MYQNIKQITNAQLTQLNNALTKFEELVSTDITDDELALLKNKNDNIFKEVDSTWGQYYDACCDHFNDCKKKIGEGRRCISIYKNNTVK